MTTRALLCLLALAPPLPAETVVFVGAPSAAGALLVAPDDGGPSVPLAGFESTHLLPLDYHGRCPLLEWMPDRPRLRADLPGAGRLVLPNAQGCLYHYRRESAGAIWFGFLYLDPAGAPQARLERPGSGPLANQDPFLSTVAVAPDGAAFLAVTTPDAGGDLYECRLADGAQFERSTTLAAQAWSGGLVLNAEYGVALSAGAAYRFARNSGAQAEAVSLSPAPAWHGGDVALSENRAWCAIVAGSAQTAAHVYVFGAAGPAARATSSPTHASSAGYAPQYEHGPFLAVSDDGQFAAWRTEGASREAWVGRVEAPVGEPAVQVSQDSNYIDTLDEIGLFGFTAGAQLLLGVGELADPVLGGLEALDLFRASPPAAGAVGLTNLTLTSGDASAPFTVKGSIDLATVRRVPGTSLVLIASEGNDAGELLRVDLAQPASAVLVDQIKELNWIEQVGAHILLSARRSTDPKTQDLVRIGPVSGTTVLASLADGFEFGSPALRADGVAGLRLSFTDGQWIVALHVPSGLYTLPTALPLQYGPALGFGTSGRLHFTSAPALGAGWPAFALGWNPAGSLVLHEVQPGPLVVLPRD
jgi:hypothetical protein